MASGPREAARSNLDCRGDYDLSSDQPALGFVGAGRAGSALSLALVGAGYPITSVYSRTPEHARLLAQRTGATLCASAADAAHLSEVLFLTVPDGAISAVSDEIAREGGFHPGAAVLHASGSLTAGALDSAAEQGALAGVFHPLQALSGPDSARLLHGSYVGVEAGPELLPVLRDMARDLGCTALEVGGDCKLPYHIAAVLAANYTLVLTSAAAQLLETAGVSADQSLAALLPLVRGSLSNLEHEGVGAGLTGPIVRDDPATIERHLEYLQQTRPELAELYRRLGVLALELAGQPELSPNVRRALET